MAASGIFNITAEVPKASQYWFLGVAGSVTAKGYYLNAYGLRTGSSFSTAIPQGSGTNDPVRLSAVPPADAVGAVVRFSGAVHFDIVGSAAFSQDFETNYANYPQYDANANVLIGRVGL